jgi:FMN-dependent NADH-azoreductase
MRLLHIDSSIQGSNSVSRTLSAEVVAAERAKSPGLAVTYRDLAAEPLQHLSPAHLAAAQPGEAELPAALRHDLAQGQAALDEFLAADVVVIGTPMYNFTIPSQLKAWIDRVCVAGKTFKYGESGVIGLAGGKRLIVVSSRGGMYGAGSPWSANDHQETYLSAVFGFLGVTDVTFVRAEGLKMAGHFEPSMAAARATIAALPAGA